MLRATVFPLILIVIGAPGAAAQLDERWQARSGRGHISFYTELTRDLGIEVRSAVPDEEGRPSVVFRATGELELVAPGSLFRDFGSGELRLDSSAVLRLGGTDLPLQGMTLRRGPDDRTVTLLAADGRPLFNGDHMHLTTDRKAGSLRLFNIDLRLTPDSARLLGDDRYTGIAVGVLELILQVAIPPGSAPTPEGACTTPFWGVPPSNDVALIGIDSLQQMAREGSFPSGRIALAPSSTLKNVGSTDVPWHRKFTGTFPPYNNDQHPFLVWNMYRIANGAIEQIGASPLKHAFFAVNNFCACAGGDILWATCEDTYSTGTNDTLAGLGPRDEVSAHPGIWQRCYSFFDPECDDVENSIPPRADAMDRRMAVLESDLQTPAATYYIDSWYLVRDDVNIFNTMGWLSVTPNPGSIWTFGLGPALTAGPVIDQWVNPAAPGPNAQSVTIDTTQGKMRLAVRARDLGGGQWQYEYALMNLDFDPRVKSFSVTVPAGATPTGIGFHDVDQDAATDWAATVADGAITWTAPTYAATQDYSTLFNFRFTVNAAPSGPGGVGAGLAFAEARAWRLTQPILGPETTTLSGPGPLTAR